MSGVKFNEAYKTIRNRLRRFSLQSIIAVCLREIQEKAPNRMAEVKKIPWFTLLIVKWACQDKMADKQAVGNMTLDDLVSIKNEIWRLPERLIQRDIDDSYSVFLMLRQAFNPQFEFQREIHSSFIREAAIIDSLGSGHGLYRDFVEVTGLLPEEFIDFSMASFAAISRNQLHLPIDYFRSLEIGYSKDKIDIYRHLVSADQCELVEFSRALPDANKKNISELYEFPVLARYPFYRSTHGLYCWHRVVFIRGLDGIVHTLMSENRQRYIEPFSRVFEQYVIDVASVMGGSVYTDEDIKGFQKQGSKNPDLLLSFEDCNIFVEVKAGLFNQSTMTAGHSQILRQKTKAIQTAINQARVSSCSIKSAAKAPSQVLQASAEYLLIVTNKELHAGNGETLSSLYPSNSLEEEGENGALPLSNIYTISVDDFERLAVGSRLGSLVAPNFLENCVIADKNQATKKGHMSQHLTAHGVPMHVSELVKNAAMASVDRIGAVTTRTYPRPDFV